MHVSIDRLKAMNAARWAQCQILPNRQHEVASVARRLCDADARARYQAIALATNVPWFIIAVIHEREAGGPPHFDKQLGQGDPLIAVSRHVPRGRGPFLNHPDDAPLQDAFFRGAVDALVNCPPQAARWTDWSAGGALTILELYNGTGYEDYHNEPSPYDWGATSIEQRGKYVADGKWSATVWDTQVGCAAMLKAMMAIDPSIAFADSNNDYATPGQTIPPGA